MITKNESIDRKLISQKKTLYYYADKNRATLNRKKKAYLTIN